MEKLYFITTADELEYPVAVANSLEELADVYGKNVMALYQKLRHQMIGCKCRDYKIEIVEIEDEE